MDSQKCVYQPFVAYAKGKNWTEADGLQKVLSDFNRVSYGRKENCIQKSSTS